MLGFFYYRFPVLHLLDVSVSPAASEDPSNYRELIQQVASKGSGMWLVELLHSTFYILLFSPSSYINVMGKGKGKGIL